MSSDVKTFQFTLVTGPSGSHRFIKNALLLLAGATATVFGSAIFRRLRGGRKPSSAVATVLRDEGLGAKALETRAVVDHLLASHYGRREHVLPTTLLDAPSKLAQELDLYYRLGVLAERHCAALQDFTGEREEPLALDICCSVGRGSFELARSFQRVWAIDPSTACINAAKTMLERGWMRYNAVEEGDLTMERTATAPEGVDADRIRFFVADPLNIPNQLQGPFDAVLAANVLCRVQDPGAFLRQLGQLVRPGGIAVLSSPYDWRESCTPRAKWLGGYTDREGKEVWSAEALRGEMQQGFRLVAEEQAPYIVREHSRRYEFSVADVTVWKRL